MAAPSDRPPLFTKTSKSRLSKQAEVEDEYPPVNHHQTAQTSAAAINIPETRVESFETDDPNLSPQMKSKVLVRSHALCGDDDTKLCTNRIEKQSSSKTGSAGSSLSRDSSSESKYTDSTGINLEEFIVSTLHKNQKDRQMLLHLEEEMRKVVQDTSKQVQRFPQMSSYNRMLVHRVAAFFGLNHNVDQTGTSVVVNKTDQTRLPELCFRDYIKGEVFTEEPKRVLRREGQSYEEVRGEMPVLDYRKTRSFEEREDEYERAKARIFNQDSSSSVEVVESPISGYSSDSMQHGLHGFGYDRATRPWSSTDTGSYSSSLDVPVITARSTMQKAGSFGGMSAVYRQTAVETSQQRVPRRSNTDATSRGSDFSPGSIGGRQPSIPEGSVMVGSPASIYGTRTPILPGVPGSQVVFAVASVDQVPPGAIIINPQTGAPYVNPSGTPYHHSGNGSNYAQPPVGPYLPPTPQSFIPVDTLTGQMQSSLSMQQTSPVGVSDPAQSIAYSPSGQSTDESPNNNNCGQDTLDDSTNTTFTTTRVLAYMMPQQSGADPGAPSSQPMLLPVHSYMQPTSLQYHSSGIPFLIPPAHTIYTQAQPDAAGTTQVTYAQSLSPSAYNSLYGCPSAQMTYVLGTAADMNLPVPSGDGSCPPDFCTEAQVTENEEIEASSFGDPSVEQQTTESDTTS